MKRQRTTSDGKNYVSFGKGELIISSEVSENNKQFVDSIQNFNNAKYKYCIALSIIHIYKIFLFTNGSKDNYSTK